ncbi:FAD/NAD(P)-binding domain-containing protein [Cristinia sonorae]|uniref:FAD/NAD(P)-binding domain-containing protein n=1 Tax=Cristinia sonorae TaxID=1940300 RepID=A0A8K0UDX3_9AGAR|nr:FAD/NAD(P)-binding domain-containing protein [Cristinia sonorae]
MELGASIFVRANKNLWRATEEFNLTRTGFTGDDDGDETGIWDGEKFVFTMGASNGWLGGWWNSLKVVWRYGYRAPKNTQAIVDGMVSDFKTLYSPAYGAVPWKNVSEVSDRLGWPHFVSQSVSEYLDLQGIDRRWTRELVEAATRVNYGQDVDRIHALGGFVSLAATGASSVEGGNFQIFEQFVKHSKANVYFNTTVTSVKRDTSNLWTVESTSSQTGTMRYRAVILAAPYHSTSISFPSSLATVPPPQPYVNLHVTLLATTTASANPEYFGLSAEKAKTPRVILTTAEGRRNGGRKPEFNSLTFHGKVRRVDGAEGVEENLVKVFSEERIGDEWLEKMFGEGKVTWVYRRLFEAYPVLPPTTAFPPIKLDEGLYYVNAFEPLISTMETETIASRNVVSLLLDDLYNAAICKPAAEDVESTMTTIKTSKPDEEFVYGWDC